MALAPRPLPDVDDPVAAPFWAAARRHRLELQRCASCSYVAWPPARVCPSCLSSQLAWTESGTGGEVWSYAVYHRALHPGFAPLVPYTVAAVALDAGPLLLGGFDGEPEIGRRVVVGFEDVAEGVALVRFAPSDEGVP